MVKAGGCLGMGPLLVTAVVSGVSGNPGELTTKFLPGKAWQWQWAFVLLVDGDGIVDMAMVVGEGVQ